MSKDNPLYELKEIIKSKSIGIRTLKFLMKSTMKEGEYAGSLQFKLYLEEKPCIRAHHIAYCELRGTQRSSIEGKVAEGNEPDETLISQIKTNYMEMLNSWLREKEHSAA